MRVTMLEDRQVTVDGVNTIDAEAGETYEMGDGVAQSLIDQDAAEPADENESSFDVDEAAREAAEQAAREEAEGEAAEEAARLEAEKAAAEEAARLEAEAKAKADGGADENKMDVEALESKPRPELNELATKAGVEAPEKLPNKRAVAEAIAAKAAGA